MLWTLDAIIDHCRSVGIRFDGSYFGRWVGEFFGFLSLGRVGGNVLGLAHC